MLHSSWASLSLFYMLLFPSYSALSKSDNERQIPFQLGEQSILTKTDAFQELATGSKYPATSSKITNSHVHHDKALVRFSPSTGSDRTILNDITQRMALDVWSTGEHIDICLQKTAISGLLSVLPHSLQRSHSVLISDVGQLIDKTGSHKTFQHPFSTTAFNETFFSNYQPLDTIYVWMDFIRALYPEIVEIIHLGKSYEGRPIKGIKLSREQPEAGKKKKIMIITGAQHAREWISVSTVAYLAYTMLSWSDKDRDIKYMLNDFDWILFPTLNVDGYVYSFEVDRLWRKNRQPTGFPFCTGIDINRNWDFKWPKDANSPIVANPCSENYQGEEPFQAIEPKLLANYITHLRHQGRSVIAYLDFHSYAQKILYPFAYDCAKSPPNLEDLEELAIGAARAIKKTYGKHFSVESACDYDGFGEVNGGSAVDWVYSQGIHFSYLIKLRDTGTYGFLLPPEEIIPSGEEIFSMTKFLSKFIAEKEGIIH